VSICRRVVRRTAGSGNKAAPDGRNTIITLNNGEFTVVDGPFTEAKELVGGWALMECRDKDEAVTGFERAAALAQNNRERQLSVDCAAATKQLATSSSRHPNGC
jgi:hypothetical protein